MVFQDPVKFHVCHGGAPPSPSEKDRSSRRSWMDADLSILPMKQNNIVKRFFAGQIPSHAVLLQPKWQLFGPSPKAKAHRSLCLSLSLCRPLSSKRGKRTGRVIQRRMSLATISHLQCYYRFTCRCQIAQLKPRPCFLAWFQAKSLWNHIANTCMILTSSIHKPKVKEGSNKRTI